MSRLNQLQDSVLRSLVQMRQSEAQDPLRNLARYVQPALDMMELDRARKERDEQRAYSRARDAVADERYAREFEYQLEQDRSKRDWLELQRQDNLNALEDDKSRNLWLDSQNAAYKELDWIYRMGSLDNKKQELRVEGKKAEAERQRASRKEYDEVRGNASKLKSQRWLASHPVTEEDGKLVSGVDDAILQQYLKIANDGKQNPESRNKALSAANERLVQISASQEATPLDVLLAPNVSPGVMNLAASNLAGQIGSTGIASQEAVEAMRMAGADISPSIAGGVKITHNGNVTFGYPKGLASDLRMVKVRQRLDSMAITAERLRGMKASQEDSGMADAFLGDIDHYVTALNRPGSQINDNDLGRIEEGYRALEKAYSRAEAIPSAQEKLDAGTASVPKPPPGYVTLVEVGNGNKVPIENSETVGQKPSQDSFRDHPVQEAAREPSMAQAVMIPGSGNPFISATVGHGNAVTSKQERMMNNLFRSPGSTFREDPARWDEDLKETVRRAKEEADRVLDAAGGN